MPHGREGGEVLVHVARRRGRQHARLAAEIAQAGAAVRVQQVAEAGVRDRPHHGLPLAALGRADHRCARDALADHRQELGGEAADLHRPAGHRRAIGLERV